jgi:hypothetical protein
MRTIVLSILIICAGAAAERSTTTTPSTTSGTSSGSSNDQQQNQQWMQLTQPGTEHQQLAKLAGRYDVQAKCWMPSEMSQPGQKQQGQQQQQQPQSQQQQAPMESTAQATFTPIFDGRFVREDFTGQMMGQPFTGVGIEGFDRVRQQWTIDWFDSMSTGTVHAKGTSTDNGKTVTFLGDFSCPMTGAVVPTRMIRTIGDDGHISFEMYATRNGKEDKTMELHYTRAKGEASQR